MPENVREYQGDLDLNISKVSTIKNALPGFVSDAIEEQVEPWAATQRSHLRAAEFFLAQIFQNGPIDFPAARYAQQFGCKFKC